MDKEARAAYIEADRKYVCRTTPFTKDMVVEVSDGCYVYDVDGTDDLVDQTGIAVINAGLHRVYRIFGN